MQAFLARYWLEIALIAAASLMVRVAIRTITVRRAVSLLEVVFALFLLEWIARRLSLNLLSQIAASAVQLVPIAVVVLYREEVSRVLAEIGRLPLLGIVMRRGSPADTIAEVVTAASIMADHRTGGTIAMERNVGLRAEIDRGISIDSHVTYDLIVSIFQPGSPLHDGAIVIQDDRIAAARVFLPMTTNAALARRYGSRHQSAVGLTEGSDAAAIVVSEERGVMTLVVDGRLTECTKTELEEALRKLFSQHIRAASQAAARRKQFDARRSAAVAKTIQEAESGREEPT